jgi:phosphoribosylformylglycinamidine synthase
VRAALACHDLSLALETPFISGKDSLNNEFSFLDRSGQKQTIAVPPSLLISAIGSVDDVSRCVTMDLKQPGNLLFLVGETKDELGGSHFAMVNNLDGGQVPTVDPQQAKATFAAVHRAIDSGLVASCHDLSEGGLAAAIAEMAFAGGLGAEINLDHSSSDEQSLSWAARLFAESNTRFICEVKEEQATAFEASLPSSVPWRFLGVVRHDHQLTVNIGVSVVIKAALRELKKAWQRPLRW